MRPENSTIGVLTYHNGPNYGGFLQAWHLRRAIEKCTGKPVEIVNFQNRIHRVSESPRVDLLHPSSFKSYWHLHKKMRPFRAAIESLTSGILITDNSEIPWKQYEQIVVGSDVVWNFSEPRFGAEPAYFGMATGQDATRMIAYAVSCGTTPAATPAPLYVTEGLKRFRHVLVRDENTQEFVMNNLGSRPRIVIDPTWLGDDPQVSIPKEASKPYILIYGSALNPQNAGSIRTYAKQRGYQMLGVFCNKRWVDRMLWNITPFEWVALIKHAKAVISSSFHGTIYAAKYGIPVMYVRSAQTAIKTSSILKAHGLDDRILPNGETASLERLHGTLDFPTHVLDMESLRIASLDALKQSLHSE